MPKNNNTHIYHSHYGQKSIYNNPNLIISLILNFSSSVIQIIASILSNCLALAADAFNKLDYSVSILINYSISKENKREDKFETAIRIKRLEIAVIFLKVILLTVIAAFLIIEAHRAFSNEGIIKSRIVIIFGGAGLIANIISLLILFTNPKKNQKLKHLYNNQLFSLMSSGMVVVCGILTFFYNNYFIDAITTFIIIIFIFKEIFHSIKQAFLSALNVVPEETNLTLIKSEIEKYNDVLSVSNMKAINFGDNDIQLFCTVELKKDILLSETKLLKRKIKEILQKHKISGVTLQFSFNKNS